MRTGFGVCKVSLESETCPTSVVMEALKIIGKMVDRARHGLGGWVDGGTKASVGKTRRQAGFMVGLS